MTDIAVHQDRFLGIPIRPLTRRRLKNFTANRRGFWSLWIFLAMFVLSLFAEMIANDRPILIRYDGGFYTPFLVSYAETEFGGEFPTEADYTDTFVVELIEEKGWILWPTWKRRRRRRRRPETGLAPTTSPAMSWRGSSTDSGFPSCSG